MKELENVITAEQVRKAISIGGVWDEDYAMFYVSRTDMQTIADELNAALDGEKCELEETETLENVTAHVLECSECGRTCEHVNGDYPRCPYCGRMVKR